MAASLLLAPASCTIHIGDERKPVLPRDIAREEGSVEIVAHLGIPNIGTETSPAWDPERIERGQQKMLDRLGSHATVIERPIDEAKLVLEIDLEGIDRLERIGVLNGYHLRNPDDAYDTKG